MSPRFMLGIAVAIVTFAPIVLGARGVRRRFLPGWAGPPALLAELVLGIGSVVLVAEALGAVGLFALVPLSIALVLVGGGAWFACRGRAPVEGAVADERRGIGRAAVAVVLLAGVAAAWSTRAVEALNGIANTESLRYHLPVAGRFVQTGTFHAVHYVDDQAGPLIAFYPFRNEVLHAIGILYLGTDLLSIVLNIGLAAIALLAAWCIGRPYGAAPACLVGALVVLATPHFVAGEAGNATNDVLGMAMIMAAAAFLVVRASLADPSSAGGDPPGDHRSDVPALALAALAAGLALGSKYTFIPAYGALTLGVLVVLAPGRRVRLGAAWVVVGVLSGSYWYLRNWFMVGNPMPPLEVELGPLALPAVPTDVPSASIAGVLFDATAWSEFLSPGLRLTLGPAWWAIGILVVAATVLVAFTGRGTVPRVLAGVALATVIGYIVVPQALGTSPDDQSLFVWNVRYVSHGLMLGAVLLPLSRLFRGNRQWWVLGAFALLVAATQTDATLWPSELFDVRYAEPVTGRAVVAGLAIGVGVFAAGAVWLTAGARLRPRLTSPVVQLAALVVVVAGATAVNAHYRTNRYAEGRGASDLIEWAMSTSDQRIAIVGLQLQYILYGSDVSNHVQYVGERTADNNYIRIATCGAWRRAINRGDYTHVLTAPVLGSLEVPPEQAWTDTDPAVHLELRTGATSLYRVDDELDPAGCPDPRPARPGAA